MAIDPDMQFERMQAELIAERQKPAALPMVEGVLRTVINSAAVSGRKCYKAQEAALAAKESEARHKAELERVKLQHSEAKKLLKMQQSESARAISVLERKNLVLGAQIAQELCRMPSMSTHESESSPGDGSLTGKRVAGERAQIA